MCMLRGLGYTDRADFYRTIYAGACDDVCMSMPLPVSSPVLPLARREYSVPLFRPRRGPDAA